MFSAHLYENQILCLHDNNIYDYYVTPTLVVPIKSADGITMEIHSDFNSIYTVEVKSSCIKSLIKKVCELSPNEATLSKHLRMQICMNVWNKFQRNLETEKEMFNARNFEYARDKMQVNELIQKLGLGICIAEAKKDNVGEVIIQGLNIFEMKAKEKLASNNTL